MIKKDLRKFKKILRKIRKNFKNLNVPKITINNLKKKLVLALCSIVIAGTGIGMASIPHEEKPVAPELLEEAMAEEVTAEPEEIIEEEAEVKVCEEGCILEEGHEGDCVVKKEDAKVILKSTSMERDLKVKFVDEATGKVISGAAFKMKLTDPSKKTKEYSDHDNDGIIWVKDIEGGNYTVAMMELEGYVTAKTLNAEVKKKIEYKVVEVADEVKSESEVVVSQEDGDYGGADKDDSTSNSTVLKDTVEFVASKKEEKVVTTDVQKKDKDGQPEYAKQKLDALGQPMYKKIVKESANFHEDPNKDNVCDRCGASMVSCTSHTDANNDQKCDTCGTAVDASLHQHTDSNGDNTCDGCNATIDKTVHEHTDTATIDCKCDVCEEAMHTLTNGICTKCHKLIDETKHTTHSEALDAEGNCTDCKKHILHINNNNDLKCDVCAADMPEVVEVITPVASFALRPFYFLGTAAEPAVATADIPKSEQFIEYDTSSAKVYDTTSAKVYETKTTTVYYGWQTIDGATYYFDKNGNKVTGQQVIQGISYTFNSDGVRSGTIGIDVSKYQRNINWTKIKNAGINFVMIRCGYRGYGSGVLVQDEMFVSHIKGAKAAGLRVGIYFFSQAINEAEAVEEASMAVSLAKKYGINMPIAIDSEYANSGKGRADGLSKSARTTVTKAFCNTVKNSGYTPMVYASKSWFGSKLDVSQLSGYRIWVAHYSDKCGYTGTYHIWQHTDKGKVDGYSGYLDMNISSI